MLRSLCFVFGLGLLAICPALSDIIDVTVNGSVSGSGTGVTECGTFPVNPPPGCFQPPGGPFLQAFPFSFSGTNTELGAFSASGNAMATGPQTIPGSISAYADQETTATLDSLEITLVGGHTLNALTSFFVSEQDTISVSFDLTGESVLQLTGGIPANPALTTGELLDSDGNVVLVLPNGTMSASTLLQPGIYQLDASVEGSAGGGFPQDGSVVDFELDLDASFTPVPEARWAILGALLSLMVGGYVVSRRRCAS